MKLTVIFPISDKRMILIMIIEFSFIYKIIQNSQKQRKIAASLLTALIILFKGGRIVYIKHQIQAP